MNRTLVIVLGVVGVLVLIILGFVGYGISVNNRIVSAEEGVKAGWSQVENQYQRRYDLIPNLVETVKGFAKQEREVLENVTNARSDFGPPIQYCQSGYNHHQDDQIFLFFRNSRQTFFLRRDIEYVLPM